MVVTPFDSLGVATTGGVWTYVGAGSTGAAPLPPNPPATYDGTLDFTGVAAGSYPYKYTVSDVACASDDDTIYTANVSKAIPVKNDECGNARAIVFPYNGGTSIIYDQTLDQECPGTTMPTWSGAIATPTEWSGMTLGVDTWFKVTFDETYPLVPIIACGFTVDGAPYGNDGITEPVLAIYSDCVGTLTEAEVPQGGTQEINITLTDIFDSPQNFWLRVSCPSGYEGKFDLILTV